MAAQASRDLELRAEHTHVVCFACPPSSPPEIVARLCSFYNMVLNYFNPAALAGNPVWSAKVSHSLLDEVRLFRNDVNSYRSSL